MKLILGLAAAILLIVGVNAFADDETTSGHPPHNQQLHDKFYSTWLRPDTNFRNSNGERQHSCCNNNDCEPVDGVKYENGAVWMLRHKDQRWIMVPPEKLEHLQEDSRESPDGRSHMCSIGVNVFCAVLGSGI